MPARHAALQRTTHPAMEDGAGGVKRKERAMVPARSTAGGETGKRDLWAGTGLGKDCRATSGKEKDGSSLAKGGGKKPNQKETSGLKRLGLRDITNQPRKVIIYCTPTTRACRG